MAKIKNAKISFDFTFKDILLDIQKEYYNHSSREAMHMNNKIEYYLGLIEE